jgi:hypothetical protein
MRLFLKFLILFCISFSSANAIAWELFKKEVKVKVQVCSTNKTHNMVVIYTYKLENNKIYEFMEGLDKDNTRYGGTLSTLDNCTILDSKNWACDGFNGISVVNGKITIYKNIGTCPIKYEQIN